MVNLLINKKQREHILSVLPQWNKIGDHIQPHIQEKDNIIVHTIMHSKIQQLREYEPISWKTWTIKIHIRTIDRRNLLNKLNKSVK